MQNVRSDLVELRQASISLTEIAVLLIIAGLLLGLAFKGQDLIHTSTLRQLADDFQTAPLVVRNYQTRFRTLPGDDASAATRFAQDAGARPVVSRVATLGNGSLEGTWDSTDTEEETQVFWYHARLAGFTVGREAAGASATGPSEPPRNVLGGRIGVESAKAGYVTGLGGEMVMCSRAIPGELALQLDTLLDDGKADDGRMRTVSLTHRRGQGAMPSAEVKPGAAYTVCLGF